MNIRRLIWTGLGVLALGSAAQAQKTPVVFWQFTTTPIEVDAWNTLIANFERANPDVDVQMEIVPWADQQQRLITALTAGGLPDVSYMGNNVVAQFQSIGALEPLNTYMQAWSRDEGQDITRDFWPGDIGYYRIRNEYYAAPLFVETRALYYRKDLFRQAGLNPDRPPSTWADLVSAAQRLTRNNVFGWGVPLSLDYSTVQTFMSVYLGYGARMLNAQGGCGFDTPQFREALNVYTAPYRNGSTAPDATTTTLTAISRAFRDGKFAMFISSPASYRAMVSENTPFLNEVGIAPIPRSPRAQAAFLGGVPLVMWRASRHKDAAARFMHYATSPKYGLRDWARATGNIPARRSLAREAPWNAAPYNVFTGQLNIARPYQYPSPPLPQMGQIEVRTVQSAVQQVALGQRSVDAATTELCTNLNGILRR